MNRMLDTAESPLDAGGPDALTVDAVVQAAHTSTDSFYARFGDRHGLLVALQDRFLERLTGHPEPAVAADVAYRTLFALATQLVMFDEDEITSQQYTNQSRATETATLLLAYLRRNAPASAEDRGVVDTHSGRSALVRPTPPDARGPSDVDLSEDGVRDAGVFQLPSTSHVTTPHPHR